MLERFSAKQLRVLNWWAGRDRDRDAVICDGAVRSGKTFCLGMSFVLWALHHPGNGQFALCGKTILSLRRNLVDPLCQALRTEGVSTRYLATRNLLEAKGWGSAVTFHLFGGKDEGSAAHIQGMTLSGVLLDEVALMPRSFVEQALARCSVTGSKFFFSCNPEHPHHWFYREWVQRAGEKNALYLHFTMEDNPTLAPETRRRYETLYNGSFYRRFVLGEWVATQGAIYPMFDGRHIVETLPPLARFAVSCDYGILNPASFGLWGLCPETGAWYRVKEYYYNARERGAQRTDEEYADALAELTGGREVECVLVDPSAASFIQCLRRRGLPVFPAKNDVLPGIRLVAEALRQDRLLFHTSCRDSIREFALYRWDENTPGDVPLKRDDHAMDDIRYFAARYLGGEEGPGFFALGAAR